MVGLPPLPSPSRYGAHTYTVIFTWVYNQTNTGGGRGGKEVEAIVKQAEEEKISFEDLKVLNCLI